MKTQLSKFCALFLLLAGFLAGGSGSAQPSLESAPAPECVLERLSNDPRPIRFEGGSTEISRPELLASAIAQAYLATRGNPTVQVLLQGFRVGREAQDSGLHSIGRRRSEIVRDAMIAVSINANQIWLRDAEFDPPVPQRLQVLPDDSFGLVTVWLTFFEQPCRLTYRRILFDWISENCMRSPNPGMSQPRRNAISAMSR